MVRLGSPDLPQNRTRPSARAEAIAPRMNSGCKRLRRLYCTTQGRAKKSTTACQIRILMAELDVRCCIAGGGPAGMMLGYLLARAGVEVLVLEKHADFLRDFRGDTVHPSTLEVMHELGLLEEFLKRPHQEVRQLTGIIGGVPVRIADFTHLRSHCRFIALMPQWDFLDFLAEHGRRFAGFHLKMQAKVTDLVEEKGQVVGVKAETPDGPLTVRSTLVVGCDGRHSTVRERAGFKIANVGAPIDVLWLRLPRRPGDPEQPAGW